MNNKNIQTLYPLNNEPLKPNQEFYKVVRYDAIRKKYISAVIYNQCVIYIPYQWAYSNVSDGDLFIYANIKNAIFDFRASLCLYKTHCLFKCHALYPTRNGFDRYKYYKPKRFIGYNEHVIFASAVMITEEVNINEYLNKIETLKW